MLIGGGVAFFSQASGQEAILYYSSVILEEAGLSRNTMLEVVVMIGCFKLGAIIVQAFVVDDVGRRPMLMISSFGMTLSMLVLGLSFLWSWHWNRKVAAIVAYIVSFSLGFGPLTYTLNCELYPTSCRAKGMLLAMSTARIASSTVTLTFVSLASLLSFPGA